MPCCVFLIWLASKSHVERNDGAKMMDEFHDLAGY
jgi:hypothetical protein